MPSFWDYISDAFRRVRGGGQPSPQPQETPYENVEPSQPIDEEEENAEPTEPVDNVYYEPGYVPAKGPRVLSRWSIGNMDCEEPPDMDDVRTLFRTVGYQTYYSIVITGVPCNEYPGKEGEGIITLGYSREGQTALNVVNVLWPSATDFANAINAQEEFHFLDCWEEVCKISILDQSIL